MARQDAVLKLYNKKGQVFRELPLSSETIMGTGNECRVIIHNNDTIFAKHCVIQKQDEKYVLVRYNDHCFVKLNDTVMKDRSAELYHGDKLTLGIVPKVFGFGWEAKRHIKRPPRVRSIDQSSLETMLNQSGDDRVSSHVAPQVNVSSYQKQEEIQYEEPAKLEEQKDLTVHPDNRDLSETVGTKPLSQPKLSSQERLQHPETQKQSTPQKLSYERRMEQTIPQTQQIEENQGSETQFEEDHYQEVLQAKPNTSTIVLDSGSEEEEEEEKEEEEDNDETMHEEAAEHESRSPARHLSRQSKSRPAAKTFKDKIKHMRKRKSSSQGSNDSQSKRSKPNPTSETFDIDQFINHINVGTVTRIQQLQQQMDTLSSENLKLKDQLRTRSDNPITKSAYSDSVQRELLADKLKFERLYETKVTELMMANDQIKKLEQKHLDLQNRYNAEYRSRAEENRLKDLYLEAKNRLAEQETLARMAQQERDSFEEANHILKKQLEDVKKKAEELRVENERHKLQIQNREVHIAQTLKSNIESAQQISQDSNLILSEFNEAKRQVADILAKAGDRLQGLKKSIGSQISAITVDVESGKSTPPEQDQPQNTSASVIRHAHPYASQTFNKDIEEARRILNKPVPKIGQLTPVIHKSTTEKQPAKQVTFSSTIQQRPMGTWTQKSTKRIAAPSQPTLCTQAPSASSSRWNDSQVNTQQMHFDNLSDEETAHSQFF